MHEILITVIGFITTSSIAFLAKMIHKDRCNHHKDHEMLKIGMTQLLKSQILDIYNRAKDKGHLGEHEKDVASDLFASYQALGGNGYIKKVMQKISEM